jgi:glutathione-specific gamma-glutamylcyclotransferase
MGYQISQAERDSVLKHLDHREKNGYDRHHVKFYPHSSETNAVEPKQILLYVAKHDNPSFAGMDEDLEKIADQMYTAVGESGSNREYVHKLVEAMQTLFPEVQDDHLFGIERILLQRELQELGRSKRLSVDRASLCQDG